MRKWAIFFDHSFHCISDQVNKVCEVIQHFKIRKAQEKSWDVTKTYYQEKTERKGKGKKRGRKYHNWKYDLILLNIWFVTYLWEFRNPCCSQKQAGVFLETDGRFYEEHNLNLIDNVPLLKKLFQSFFSYVCWRFELLTYFQTSLMPK